MATNGNDPRLDQLEKTLRGVVPQPVNEIPAAKEAVYDLMARASDTTRSIRDLANYSNRIADDLDSIIATYVSHMHQLMGKIAGN